MFRGQTSDPIIASVSINNYATSLQSNKSQSPSIYRNAEKASPKLVKLILSVRVSLRATACSHPEFLQQNFKLIE